MRTLQKILFALGLLVITLCCAADDGPSPGKMAAAEAEGILWSRTSAEALMQAPLRRSSVSPTALLQRPDRKLSKPREYSIEGHENAERLMRSYQAEQQITPDQRKKLYNHVAKNLSRAKSTPYPPWQSIGIGTLRTPSLANVYATSGRVSKAQYAYDRAQGLTVLWTAGSRGGLWKVVHTGLFAYWTPVSHSMPDPSVGAFLVDRTNSDRLLIGTGDPWRATGSGLYRSIDAGDTWAHVATTPTPTAFYKILQDRNNPNIVLAAANTGLFRSETGGSSWTRVYDGDVSDLAQDPSNPSHWYAGLYGVGILESNNSGAEFHPMNGDGGASAGLVQPFGRISLAVCESAPNYIYALVESGFNLQAVFRSSNSGANWVSIHAADTNNSQGANLSIAVHPSDPNRVAIGLIWSEMTTNATSPNPTWTGYNGGHPDITSFLFVPDSVSPGNTRLIVTNDGGIYMSDYATTGGTVSDTLNTLGLNVQEMVGGGNVAGSRSEPNFLLASLQDNGIVTINPNEVRLSMLGDGGQVSISPDNADHLYGSAGSGWVRFYSNNRGANWYGINCSFPLTEWAPVVLVDPRPGLSTRNVFTSTIASGVWFKPANTTACDWRSVGPDSLSSSMPAFNANYIEKAMNPFYDVLYLSKWGDSRLFVYDSQFDGALGAMTQHQVRTPPLAPRTSVLDDGHATADRSSMQWDTVYYTTVWRLPPQAFLSRDRGRSWTEVTGNLASLLPNAYFYQLVGNPNNMNELFLATSVGVFYSRDRGGSWEAFNQGLPAATHVSNMALQFDNTADPKLYIGTRGQGFWSRSLTSDVLFENGFE